MGSKPADKGVGTVTGHLSATGERRKLVVCRDVVPAPLKVVGTQ